MTQPILTPSIDSPTHAVNATTVIDVSPPSKQPRSADRRYSRESVLWLLATGLMFLTGLLKGINLLILLAYLLAGLWFVNYRFARQNLARVRGQRLLPGPVFAGNMSEMRLELTSGDNRPARGITVVDRGPAHDKRFLLLHLATGRQERIRFSILFADRGRYQFEPLLARSRFPFGLAGGEVELAPGDEWIVLPKLGKLHAERLKEWLAKTTRGDGRSRRRRPQPTMQEADIHGLRDFRAGDSPRWIHWRSSARRDQLLVREFEDSARPDLILVVEPWLPASPTSDHRDHLEATISLAATICWEWCRDWLSRLTLIVAGKEPIVLPAGTGTSFALKALEGLAILDGGPTEPPAHWLDRMPRATASTPILAISSRVNSPIVDELAGAIGRPVACVYGGEMVEWYEAP